MRKQNINCAASESNRTDRVLVIDQEEDQSEVANGLREMGLQVDDESNSERGFRRIQDEPNLAIVSSMRVCHRCRLRHSWWLYERSPRVKYSWWATAGETAMVETLIGGADVYLERPARIRELAARVRSLSRRYGRELGLKGNLNLIGEGTQLGPAFDNLSQTEAKAATLFAEAGRVVNG